jgi:hypothetical protein
VWPDGFPSFEWKRRDAPQSREVTANTEGPMHRSPTSCIAPRPTLPTRRPRREYGPRPSTRHCRSPGDKSLIPPTGISAITPPPMEISFVVFCPLGSGLCKTPPRPAPAATPQSTTATARSPAASSVTCPEKAATGNFVRISPILRRADFLRRTYLPSCLRMTDFPGPWPGRGETRESASISCRVFL